MSFVALTIDEKYIDNLMFMLSEDFLSTKIQNNG